MPALREETLDGLTGASMNPFVELFRNPVGTLSAVGYFLALVMLLILTLGVCWSNAATVRAQYQANWTRWQYNPPVVWLARVAAIPGILAIDAWVVATLIWLVA